MEYFDVLSLERGRIKMLKIFYPGALPLERFSRFVLMPTPESIIRLQRRFSKTQNHLLSQKFSRILHCFRIGGVWKRTNEKRFVQTSNAILEQIKGNELKEVSWLDIGASDGITTYELNQQLLNLHIKTKQTVIMDPFVKITRYGRGPIKEYRDRNGDVFLLRCLCFALSIPQSTHRINAVFHWLEKYYLSKKVFRASLKKEKDIELINPLVKEDQVIKFSEEDCRAYNSNYKEKFHFVRASNVLNKQYFSDIELSKALSSIQEYLKENGILLVSRSVDKRNTEYETGTLWIKKNGKLQHTLDIGGGSEVKNLVNS
jgi:hypothetical protein